MNTAVDQKVVMALQALCAGNEVARRLFASFAQRQKDASETSVERAAWLSGVDYGSMLQLYKQLDEIKIGRFIAGRHGYVSRIAWSYSIRSLGKVAQGKARKLEDVAPDADSDEPSAEIGRRFLLNEHEFQLRNDLKVKLSLPGDLTSKEAERMAAFLKTLPL